MGQAERIEQRHGSRYDPNDKVVGPNNLSFLVVVENGGTTPASDYKITVTSVSRQDQCRHITQHNLNTRIL